MRMEYTDKPKGLGKKSRARLAEILRKTKASVSVQEAASILKIKEQAAGKILSRLAKDGWLYRVKKGLYVPVPLESPTIDTAIENPWVIAERVFSPCYIGGWSAAEYWELTEQIFRSVVVITAKRPRSKKALLGGIEFLLKSVSSRKIFGTSTVWKGNVRVQVSDPSRTIIDMLDDPQLGGGIRSVYDIFKNYLASKYKKLYLLTTYAGKLGNRTVFKRLGYLIEREIPDEKRIIEKCRANMSQGYSRLDPSLPGKKLITRWHLFVPANWIIHSND